MSSLTWYLVRWIQLWWPSQCSSADKVLPSVLQKADVSIMSQTECKKTYGLISPRMLCAGVPSGERDACRVGHLLRLTVHYCAVASLLCESGSFLDSLFLRGIREDLCPVRRQVGVAGSWSGLSAGGLAVADQIYQGFIHGSTSSHLGSTVISADMKWISLLISNKNIISLFLCLFWLLQLPFFCNRYIDFT